MASKAGVGPGSCQRIFELGARSVDLDLLDEWGSNATAEESGVGGRADAPARVARVAAGWERRDVGWECLETE